MDKNIWVVDDDESIRWVLEKGLADSGMDVQTFDSANKVIKKLETENPQLILTDIRMPGPSGIDLLDKVKELRPDEIVKGGDYKVEDIAGHEFAPVVLFNYNNSYSTTKALEKLNS